MGARLPLGHRAARPRSDAGGGARLMKLAPTASATVGPFFHFALDRPEWSDLTSGGKAQGEKMTVEGSVTDGDGVPTQDCFVEIWRASPAGRYDHAEDTQEKPLDPNFRGFGRSSCDAE